MPRHRAVRPLMLAIVLFLGTLATGCGGADANTRTGAGKLGVDCETSLDACKAKCRSEGDQASRGPCYDRCLRNVQACRE